MWGILVIGEDLGEILGFGIGGLKDLGVFGDWGFGIWGYLGGVRGPLWGRFGRRVGEGLGPPRPAKSLSVSRGGFLAGSESQDPCESLRGGFGGDWCLGRSWGDLVGAKSPQDRPRHQIPRGVAREHTRTTYSRRDLI